MRTWILTVMMACVACSARHPAAAPPSTLRTVAQPPLVPGPEVPAPPSAANPVQLVESAPAETVLNHADVPDAKDIWPEIISRATATLDFAEFYASNQPGSTLERVIQAIEAAAARGVHVRFLAEEKFYKTYPETLDRLASRPGIEVRRYPGAKLLGGILHAKYFLVDGREVYLGSQNFDWRALEHIQELGLDVRQPQIARALQDVFETDWALAGGADPATTRVHTPDLVFPVTVAQGGEVLQLTPVYSPKGFLPDESLWDLPRLVGLIDDARRSIRVQLLTYRATTSKGERLELDTALRRASARGVKVELLLSSWSKGKKNLPDLLALAALPNVQVRIETIPRWSHGDIEFARVVHAKYMSVDGERTWIGTSNWEEDYFTQNRNVGLIVEGARFATRLERFFDDGWNGPYTAPLEGAPK